MAKNGLKCTKLSIIKFLENFPFLFLTLGVSRKLQV